MRTIEIKPDKASNRLFVKMPDGNYYKCSLWFLYYSFDDEDRHLFNLSSILYEFYTYYLHNRSGELSFKMIMFRGNHV